MLKVINNDTYKEIPKVFNKVSPYTYAKNKRGYTIIAESRISDQPSGPGRWRLRLIGSSPSLIAPRGNKSEIISAFDIRDTRDYYIPNENKVIMRYKVVVTDDHLTTLQLTASKPDVYIKLSIFDNGEEITSVIGKGTAVIPAFIFMKDRLENTNDVSSLTSRPGSKTSNSFLKHKRIMASILKFIKIFFQVISSGRASKTIGAEKGKDKNKRSSSVNSNEVKDNKNAQSVSFILGKKYLERILKLKIILRDLAVANRSGEI